MKKFTVRSSLSLTIRVWPAGDICNLLSYISNFLNWILIDLLKLSSLNFFNMSSNITSDIGSITNRLNKYLSLSARINPSVTLSKDLLAPKKVDWSKSMIGRICCEKEYSIGTVCQFVSTYWNFDKELEVVCHEKMKNTFIFSCKNAKDFYTLKHNFWQIEGYTLILREIPRGFFTLQTMITLNMIPMWVQIVNIPQSFLTLGAIKRIVTHIGTFRESSHPLGTFFKHKTIRVLLWVKVENNLPMDMLVSVDEQNKKELLEFKYENLPLNFCNICRVIDHNELKCKTEFEPQWRELQMNASEAATTNEIIQLNTNANTDPDPEIEPNMIEDVQNYGNVCNDGCEHGWLETNNDSLSSGNLNTNLGCLENNNNNTVNVSDVFEMDTYGKLPYEGGDIHQFDEYLNQTIALQFNENLNTHEIFMNSEYHICIDPDLEIPLINPIQNQPSFTSNELHNLVLSSTITQNSNLESPNSSSPTHPHSISNLSNTPPNNNLQEFCDETTEEMEKVNPFAKLLDPSLQKENPSDPNPATLSTIPKPISFEININEIPLDPNSVLETVAAQPSQHASVNYANNRKRKELEIAESTDIVTISKKVRLEEKWVQAMVRNIKEDRINMELFNRARSSQGPSLLSSEQTEKRMATTGGLSIIENTNSINKRIWSSQKLQKSLSRTQASAKGQGQSQLGNKE